MAVRELLGSPTAIFILLDHFYISSFFSHGILKDFRLFLPTFIVAIYSFLL